MSEERLNSVPTPDSDPPPGQARVGQPAESAITPAASLSPGFQIEPDDATTVHKISVRCLNYLDTPEQHRAIRELVRYEWKANPLVAATLLHGAKRLDFQEEVRVDCVRMLALCRVNHVEVIDGLVALTKDDNSWVSAEAAKALAELKAIP